MCRVRLSLDKEPFDGLCLMPCDPFDYADLLLCESETRKPFSMRNFHYAYFFYGILLDLPMFIEVASALLLQSLEELLISVQQ